MSLNVSSSSSMLSASTSQDSLNVLAQQSSGSLSGLGEVVEGILLRQKRDMRELKIERTRIKLDIHKAKKARIQLEIEDQQGSDAYANTINLLRGLEIKRHENSLKMLDMDASTSTHRKSSRTKRKKEEPLKEAQRLLVEAKKLQQEKRGQKEASKKLTRARQLFADCAKSGCGEASYQLAEMIYFGLGDSQKGEGLIHEHLMSSAKKGHFLGFFAHRIYTEGQRTTSISSSSNSRTASDCTPSDLSRLSDDQLIKEAASHLRSAILNQESEYGDGYIKASWCFAEGLKRRNTLCSLMYGLFFYYGYAMIAKPEAKAYLNWVYEELYSKHEKSLLLSLVKTKIIDKK